ncbi:MAG: methyltransferase domain-containing protein [Bryobacteraceae bacterium]
MLEFTGERVVPGQVDCDLWNEHFARYLFAARLARRKRVLDIGCGTGYGAAELARVAASVAGFDSSPEAIALACSAYPVPNLHFLVASASAIPFHDAAFRLITCFEVIEHLADWQTLLQEAHRLLARGGQFIVSTPNKLYYAESREQVGPNPFHIHEFEYEEFKEALNSVFPSVTLYLQNHIGGLSFQPVSAPSAQSPDLHLELSPSDPRQAHFFVAVCAAARQTGAPPFLHFPSTANVLREREQHIRKIEDEIRLKDTWLGQHGQELERAQAWAQSEHDQFEASRRELLATCESYEQRLAANERAADELLNRRSEELEQAQQWAQAAHERFEAARLELQETVQVYEERLTASERTAKRLLDRQAAELKQAQEWARAEHEQFEASRLELLAAVQSYEDRLAANERAANELLTSRTREFEASRLELRAVVQSYEDRLAANERAANELLTSRTKELEAAQAWAQSEHEQFEASRRELLAAVQSYEDRLAANDRAANELLNSRAQELEKALKWAQSEHEQFEAVLRQLQATSDRYKALLEVSERSHQEDLSTLSRHPDKTGDQHQAAATEIARLVAVLDEAIQRLAETESGRQAARDEIERLRKILSLVQQSRWLKIGRGIKVGPDLSRL